MGCLKKFFKAIIIALAIIGFISIGGKEWIGTLIDKYVHKSP